MYARTLAHFPDRARPASTRFLTTLSWSLLAVLALALTTGCASYRTPPATLDYGRTRASHSGLYRGSILPEGDSLPQGKLQKWTLHLADANGAPVRAATIDVSGRMPQHGHGLPTKPRVTRELGNGDYLVEGVKFNMGGWWVVRFRVNSAVGADSLVFNLKV